MFLLKDKGVCFKKIYPEFLPYIITIGAIYYQHFGKFMLITSANDSQHLSISRHYQGKAIDIRTHDQDPVKVVLFVEALKQLLEPALDIVWEDKGKPNEHLHVEYDPK